MGVLLGKPLLRFAGRGRPLFRGKRKLILTWDFSPGPTLLPRHPVRASPGNSVACPGSTPLFRRLPGRPPRGQPRGGPPLFFPNTIRRPSEGCFPACSSVPTERSSRPPDRQSRPVRLAGMHGDASPGGGRNPPARSADAGEGVRGPGLGMAHGKPGTRGQ